MIDFCYEIDFRLPNEEAIVNWIQEVVKSEGATIQELVYIFCDDDRLLELNKTYLNHDTYTDILTFPYGDEKAIQGDIFISIPRVRDNAGNFQVNTEEELRRVMVHGVLHLLGYDDYSEEEKEKMRDLENKKMKMFHVEQ